LNTTLIRQLNVARVFHALRQHPGSSQRELAEYTQLDKATISAVVRQLVQEGLIARRDKPTAGKVGRPEVALTLSSEAGILVGARLEPKSIRLIASYIDGRVIGAHQVAGSVALAESVSLLRAGFDALLAVLALPESQVKGLGVGIPALIDLEGRLAFAPNLGWRNADVVSRLGEAFRVPVNVDNDTKAAALAEKLFGACQEVRDFVFISGHSGVGAGLYLEDKLYRGHGGFAGELGHMTVIPEGRLCSCGNRGCLEAYVSEAAILRQIAELGLELPDVWTVREAAADVRVAQVLQQAATALAIAVKNVVNLCNPERVVFGGNLAVIAPLLLPTVARYLAEHALEAICQQCQLVISPLGIESVPMGGVALALEHFLALPTWLASEQLRS
jgi:predicted NBD/HSP70 family sugar kinase